MKKVIYAAMVIALVAVCGVACDLDIMGGDSSGDGGCTGRLAPVTVIDEAYACEVTNYTVPCDDGVRCRIKEVTYCCLADTGEELIQTFYCTDPGGCDLVDETVNEHGQCDWDCDPVP